jgi:segregation and condensation protein A
MPVRRTPTPSARRPRRRAPSPAAQAATSAPGKKRAARDISAPGELADDIYRISVGGFEGPLDLLLALIREHKLDIFDIPISFVTKKYLEYLDWMQTLQIDVASEYLVMAATLAYIKSQMLLPEPASDLLDGEDGGEPLDPRAELVRRLLEYQKYKHAAAHLGQRPALGRDVFERGSAEEAPDGVAPFAPPSPFKLFEAFEQVLKRANRKIDHEVVFDRLSITERIVELTELLHDRGRLRFEQLFDGEAGAAGDGPSILSLVVTFLALLEMCRLGVALVTQEDDALGPLHVEFSARGARLPLPPPSSEDAASERLEPETLTDRQDLDPALAAPDDEPDALDDDLGALADDGPTEDTP